MRASAAAHVSALADRLGILSASICALHCLALPSLLVLGTAVPSVFGADASFHRAMLGSVVPSAVLAFGLGCWRHKDRRVLVLGTLGLLGMVLSGTVLHDWIDELGERAVTLASAALLVAAHVRNSRLCRSGSCTSRSG